jgi:hypothetical protein
MAKNMINEAGRKFTEEMFFVTNLTYSELDLSMFKYV